MSVYEALQHRRSIRSYTGESIPEKKLRMILQAGLMSESGHNKKSYELIVVRDHDALQEMSACRVGCAKMLAAADAAIVVIGDAELSDTWIEDGAVIMANMHLTADDLGVGSCWVQGRLRSAVNGESTEEFLRKLLGFPEKYRLEAILALGMPAEEKPKHVPKNLPAEKIHYGKF